MVSGEQGLTRYELLSLTASWLGAVGTIGAVWAAVWLANRQNRARVRVTATVAHLGVVGPNFGSTATTYLMISAANAGGQPITVTGITWTVGRLKKVYFAQLTMPGVPGSQCPAKLGPGEAADFLFPIDMIERTSGQLHRVLHASAFGRTRRLRVGVNLSTGEHHAVRASAAVLARIKPEAKASDRSFDGSGDARTRS